MPPWFGAVVAGLLLVSFALAAIRGDHGERRRLASLALAFVAVLAAALLLIGLA